MKKKFMLLVIATTSIILTNFHIAFAQSWSITGNNNATSSSKLGTTNSVPLKLFTNNSERMRINTSGKVGIGITNPLNILTVKSGGSTPTALWLNGLNSPVFVGFGETVSSEFLLAGASNTFNNRAVFQGRRSRGTLAAPLVVQDDDYISSLLASAYDGSNFQNPALVSFFVDGVPSAGHVPARISFVTGTNSSDRVERMKIFSSGNISLNDGQVYLQQSNGNLTIGTGDLIFNSGQQTMQFANPGRSLAPMINMFKSGTTNTDRMVIAHSPAYTNWGLQYRDLNDEFDFLGSGSSVLYIGLGSRRVGVGTASPGYVLDVAGRMRVQSGGGNTAGIWFRNGANISDVAFTGMANDNFVGFWGNTGAGWGLAMNTTSGNVGIGTLSPNYKLDVCGTIRAKELRVESGWCDYVFEKNYKLKSIDELKQFINDNKHLPGVVPASEVEKEGLKVAEMNKAMMEKIEESTLYIIELNDKIKLLENKIDELTTKASKKRK